MSALQFDGVTVTRRSRPVLVDVGVTFAAGRLSAVIGPNGAGKSSLLEAGAGLLPVGRGQIRLGDEVIGAIDRRALARRRAYLPQRAGVEWPISVEWVIALGLSPHLPAFGGLPAAMLPRVTDALEQFDLIGLRDRPATELSGGELARVMLARATVGDPELLIVDEPIAGLDPRHALDAMRRLRARADAGRTVIVAMHEIDLALRFADDIVAVRDGRIMASGSAAEVARDETLSALYDLPAQVSHDAKGLSVRFSSGK